jgi:hypothetical protein
MTKRFSLALIAIGLLALSLVLSACVAKWSPEEGVALTATAASYMVPTSVPLTPTPRPSPTTASAPTPAPTAPSATPVSSLPAGVRPAGEMPDAQLKAQVEQMMEIR